MEKNINFLLFDKMRQIERELRIGCMPGKISPEDGLCKTKNPAFKRELALVVLHGKGNNTNQKELAKEMRLSPSTLSEMLNKLEADGFLKRKTNTKDKRSAVLVLTNKGVKRAEEIEEEGNKHFAHLFRNLDALEKRQLIGLLEKIASKEETQ